VNSAINLNLVANSSYFSYKNADFKNKPLRDVGMFFVNQELVLAGFVLSGT
jgi:hypothetical protein